MLTNPLFSPSSFSDNYYYGAIWISTPPLLIEDTSLTVYLCSVNTFFGIAYTHTITGIMRVAIKEANTASTWIITESFLSCTGSECWDLYAQNFTNSLLTAHKFASLKPSTSYSLAFLACYPCCTSCAVEFSWLSYSVNITTRPAGEQWSPSNHVHTSNNDIHPCTLSAAGVTCG